MSKYLYWKLEFEDSLYRERNGTSYGQIGKNLIPLFGIWLILPVQYACFKD